MRLTKRRYFFISILVAAALFFASLACALLPFKAQAVTTDRFGYTNMKYEMAQVAPQNDSFKDGRKGLRLYAYDNGATAELKGAFYGQFDAEIKASTQDSVKPDLIAYSFIFRSLTGEDCFKLTVQDNGAETSAYVEVNGEKTGIFYNVDLSYDGKAHGYTTSQNQIGVYTRIITSNTTNIRFNPTTMEISMKNDRDEYVTVWNLSKEVMDGKRFPYVMESMSQYTVAIEFTSIKAGGKGELTVYSINGEDYGAIDLPEVAPLIYTDEVQNAIKGNAWTLPTIGVYDYAGEITANDVTYEIYNAAGEKLASGVYGENTTFTPDAAGEYYLYYVVTSKGNKGEAYLRFNAYEESNVSYAFEEISLTSRTIGVKTSLYLPERRVESNLFARGSEKKANVTVKKDGEIINGYQDVTAGFVCTFEETGGYDVIYSVSVAGKRVEAAPIRIEVSQNVVGMSWSELSEHYCYGDTLSVPTVSVYVNGEEGKASATVVAPNGKERAGTEILLDCIGIYEIRYEYSVGGVTDTFSRFFTVEYEVDDLFTLGEHTTVAYDNTTGNADMDGLLLTMNASTSSLTYDVDLSDNTKQDILLSALVIPSTPGVHDMLGFYVTLTDKLNPENYLTIRMYEGSGNAYNATFIRAKASNQPGYVGWYKQPDWNGGSPYSYTESLEKTMAHNYGGFLSGLNFGMDSVYEDLSKRILILKYDASEKAIYSKSNMEYKTDPTLREQLVVDFDDPACFSNLWSGFSDDSQVELTITPIGLSGAAQMKIFEIDGYEFGQSTVKDTSAPSVKIDLKDMSDAPKARTGAPYPVFDVIVSDDFSSEDLIKTSIAVTYGNTEIDVVDGCFTPMQNGFYTITYVVADAYGNTTKKSIEVEAVADISAVTAELDGEWAAEMHYGELFKFPKYHGVGGSGAYEYEAVVTCNGEAVESSDESVLPLSEGRYEITLYVRDYLRQTATLTKSYEVVFSTSMIIDEADVVLPPVFIDGSTYVFEPYQAEYYPSAGSEVAFASAKIEVEDANGKTVLGADRAYVPKASESVTQAKITFLFEGVANGETVTKRIERTVPVRIAEQKSGFLANYFVTENTILTAKNQYMCFETAETADLHAAFVRAVATDEFSIQFKPMMLDGAACSAFEAIVVTVTDKNHADISVRFTIRKNGSSLTFRINDESEMPMIGSLTTDTGKSIQISYNESTHAVSGVENSSLGKITKALSGKAFNGFTSNEVYVQFALVGVTDKCGINLVSINNQRFFNSAKDTTVPQLYVDGSYSGMYTSGTEITIPAARAYDVVNYCKPVTVTVKDAEGNFITATDGTVLNGALANVEYKVLLNKILRYTVTYSATDEAGQTKISSKDILIYDDVVPTLTLDTELPPLVWTGTKVTLPTYTVSDNGDISKVEVETYYVAEEEGVMVKVTDNTVTANKAGKYTVYFYLIDENDTRNVVVYSFIAVEKA